MSEIDQSRVEERIETNLALVTREFKGYDKIAARHLFSNLRHLEQIAVIAAERGDAIEGQLEDEYVHRGSFEALAERFGGLVDPSPPVQRLIDYLIEQEGEMSLAMLNVVAESWLETVFDHIGRWGYCDELMASVEADEERHVHDALEMAKPDPEQAEPVLRDLEMMLYEIAQSPQFMLPFIYFGGEEACCDMGLDLCAAHERGCDHLGIEPNTYKLRALSRSQRMFARRKPEATYMTAWEQSKMVLYPQVAPMTLMFTANVKYSVGSRIQARLAGAVARIFARNPALRVVTRQRQLYCAQESIIAVRMPYDSEQVMNVYLTDAQYKTDKEILAQLSRRTRRQRQHKYEALPPLDDGLDQLLPPSRCAVAINYNGHYGGESGTGPLSDIEGIPTLVTIGEPRNGQAVITILMDHRVADGRHIGLLKREIEQELSEDS